MRKEIILFSMLIFGLFIVHNAFAYWDDSDYGGGWYEVDSFVDDFSYGGWEPDYWEPVVEPIGPQERTESPPASEPREVPEPRLAIGEQRALDILDREVPAPREAPSAPQPSERECNWFCELGTAANNVGQNTVNNIVDFLNQGNPAADGFPGHVDLGQVPLSAVGSVPTVFVSTPDFPWISVHVSVPTSAINPHSSCFDDGSCENCGHGADCHTISDPQELPTVIADPTEVVTAPPVRPPVVPEKEPIKEPPVIIIVSSFLPGTEITTATGLKKIEDIKVGDVILGYDHNSNKIVSVTVKDLFKRTSDSYYSITTENGVIIKVTAEHPIYTPTGYVKVKNLKIGDIVFVLKDGQLAPEKIVDLQKINENVTVYNLHASDTENYFAGGVLVHNKSPIQPKIEPTESTKPREPQGPCEINPESCPDFCDRHPTDPQCIGTTQPTNPPTQTSLATCASLGGSICTGTCIGTNLGNSCCAGSCVTPPTQTCGNNIREGTEACDGSDLAAQTCLSKGYSGGNLNCNSGCTNFDTSSCIQPSVCTIILSLLQSPNFNQQTKTGTYRGTEFSWILRASDTSAISCPGLIGYSIGNFKFSGACDAQSTGIFDVNDDPREKATKVLPGFSINKGSSKDVFKVNVRATTGACTVTFDILKNGEKVDPTFIVTPASPPVVRSFDYFGNAQSFTATWEAYYPNTPTNKMNVECGLNCDPRTESCGTMAGKTCAPYPYSHLTENPKKGTCTVSNPAYDYTQNNKIVCIFYDPDVGKDPYTLVNHDFKPYDFDVTSSAIITSGVGKPFDLKFSISNKGVLQDSYHTALSASSPEFVTISPSSADSGTVNQNSISSVTSSITPLVDSDNVLTVTITSQSCSTCAPKTLQIPLKSSLFSLPDFGLAGFLTIVIVAGIVYFLLSNRMISKPNSRRKRK